MRFVKRISDSFCLRSESLPGKTIVELSGKDRLLVENYRSVLMIEADSVLLNVSFGSLNIIGEELVLEYLERDRILISGTITSIVVLGES